MPRIAVSRPRKPGKGLGADDCVARYLPIDQIQTDEDRFQNRQTAFSQASAEAVARDYDKNKFDPIVVWYDPQDGQIYVLSGHSRFAGLKMRGEQFIAARFFEGTQAAAIKFAKLEANRTANVETFIEDLNAYRLAIEGGASKAELRELFKGKVNKLKYYSLLDPNGLFIQALSQDDRSMYPFIEQRALWAGELREKYPTLTNIHERDIFLFAYSDKENLSLDKDSFLKTVEKRISMGKDRLFPECKDETGCTKIKDVDDLLKSREERDMYKRVREIEEDLKAISCRLTTHEIAYMIHTEGEKDAVRAIAEQLSEERTKLQKKLNVGPKEAPSLFGFKGAVFGCDEITGLLAALSCPLPKKCFDKATINLPEPKPKRGPKKRIEEPKLAGDDKPKNYWTFVSYSNEDGDEEFEDELNSFPPQETEFIKGKMEYYCRVEKHQGRHFYEPINEIISEFRPGDYRIFVSSLTSKSYLALCVFRKKGQKAPPKEIKKAVKRHAEYHNR